MASRVRLTIGARLLYDGEVVAVAGLEGTHAVLRDAAYRFNGLLAEGLTNADIAARLTLSPKTVENHISAVLDKLEVATRGQAVAAARRRHLVP